MSSPLNFERDRDAIPPTPASSDERYAKSVDVLNELERVLNETRIAATSAPPLEPGPGEDGAPDGDEAPPSLYSAYVPPKAPYTDQVEIGEDAAQPARGFNATSQFASRTPRSLDNLGSIAARAAAKQIRQQQQLEEHPAPAFLRNDRARTRQAHSDHVRGGARPLHHGRPTPSTALGKHGERDQVIRDILESQRPVPQHNPGKRRWRAVVGYLLLAILIACGAGFVGYQFFVVPAPAGNKASDGSQTSLASSSFAKSSDHVTAKKTPPADASQTAARVVKTTTISASQDVFPPPRPEGSAPQTDGSWPLSYEDAPRGEAKRVKPSRQLDPEEVHNLIQRGDAALKGGDIAAARLLLRRAAESGDPTGAMALGATYDPGVLAQLGVVGANGDVAVARDWYQKAADWGAPDARRRLQELAQQ